MEVLLAGERAAEQQVLQQLKSGDVPFSDIFETFSIYRDFNQALTFADFQNAEKWESRLWGLHVEGKKYISRPYNDLRKKHADKPVETRKLAKLYLLFLKNCERFYRLYLLELWKLSGRLPEMEMVAQKAMKGASMGESQQLSITPELREMILVSAHRIIVYLGDLCRYRATDELDQSPKFEPAVGWYNLADALRPDSGMGHHQHAVITLAKQQHLTTIYHLYRAMAVKHAHPLASQNLHREFARVISAAEKNTLIPKPTRNDPDVPKQNFVGSFVRMHSMCAKGEQFRAHEELERQVLSHLSNYIKQGHRQDQQSSSDETLVRVVLVNVAAQYIAGQRFRASSTDEFHQAFMYFFRFNLKTFTVLLRLFYDDLRTLLLNMENQDVPLTAKITPIGRSLLPCLRLYNNWLLPMVYMVAGLSNEDQITDAVQQFWPSYAKAIDLAVQAFPIWELEDEAEISYMLKEDADTLEFKPLVDETNHQTHKTWYVKDTGTVKPRYSDTNVVRRSPDDEMLQRVKDFLSDGVDMANDNSYAPINIRGTRIFHGDGTNIDNPVVRPIEYALLDPIAPPSKAVMEKPKIVSYAAAAASGHARTARLASAPQKLKPQSRDAQLSRMVDDLVDDDEADNPVTPPQQYASHPAVVTNGEVPFALHDSAHDIGNTLPNYAHQLKGPASKPLPRPHVAMNPPAVKPVGNGRPVSGQHDRLQSISRLWHDDTTSASSPSFALPSGPPTGTLGFPATTNAVRGHSRVNSASSIRSRNSLHNVDTWGSIDSAPGTLPDTITPQTVYGGYSSLDHTGMANPLLFGAGGGPWSYRNVSPPNGQGG